MTPPITGSCDTAGSCIISIETKQKADSIVDMLDEQERERLLVALYEHKQMPMDTENEDWITYGKLMNKPYMTDRDKTGMKKAISYLINHGMDIPLYRQKLYENVNYGVEDGKEYVKVGPVKWMKQDVSAEPDGKNIFQHDNVTYFKGGESIIKEQNDLLAKQNMEIPLDSDYEQSMKALPGNYSRDDWNECGKILSLILGMSKDGYYKEGKWKCGYGYRWSASSKDDNNIRAFGFEDNRGTLVQDCVETAFPIRPIIKK